MMRAGSQLDWTAVTLTTPSADLLPLEKGAINIIYIHQSMLAVVFISCKPPVDPVKLVTTHVENVMKTGVTQTRHVGNLSS